MSGFFNSLKSLASGAANAAKYQDEEDDEEGEDTRMRFSLMPQPGESGFTQWLDAMKMVARLPGGIPQEFRKRLWLTLAERHLEQRGVDWRQAEKLCFNEWSNPDDEELGIQIVKDLHRTGCSLFCGAAGRDNQAVLRRVLLGFARWNKSVGYCQGLNVLAALVLQVTDRAESSAVKVMIYLIEGVLPEGYFADNLRGLSVDMAVFRDLLRMRLPKLSKHLEALQIDAKDKATGSSYEPPLTNVFTMQWFLTLFCHCLPQDAVLRVWDLIFLEGDEVLLRTALAIWEGISDRIMTVTSADEFYSIMGVLTREMLEFTDTNNLIKTIVNMGSLHGVTDLREKHRYNITPWARRLSDDEETDTEDEEKLAVAAAMFEVQHRLKKGYKKGHSLATGTLQAINQGGDKDRLALDISTLKHQYAKLRERQRQAHIILSAACARQSMVPPSTSQAMNHLLVGKSALVSAKTRQLGPPPGAIPPKTRLTPSRSPRNQMRKDKQGVTLHWKDTKKSRETKNEPAVTDDVDDRDVPLSPETMSVSIKSSSRRNSGDSDSDSTSTELCDDPERLSDSEEQTSASDCYIIATDDEKSPHSGCSPVHKSDELNKDMSFDMKKKIMIQNDVETSVSIAKITDQIRRLSAGDDNNTIVLPSVSTIDMKKINLNDNNERFMKIYESKLYDDDVVNDLTTVKVDSDDFLHRNDDKIDNVDKLHENYCNLNDDDVIMDVKTTQSAQMEDKSKIDNTFKNDNLELNYLDKSLDTSTSDDHKLNKFDDVPNSKVNDEVIGKNYYSTSYVIGHLPISPMTVDQKLSKLGVSVPITTTGNFPLSEEAKSSTIYDSKVSHLTLNYHQGLKPFEDLKKSPKSPESAKSFSSGETMGPDSKVSSLTTTPIRSESSNFRDEKSVNSSVSSDDKTLTMKSIESEIGATRSKIESQCSLDNSSPSKSISIDSLKNKSDPSPTKIVVSSSSESYDPCKLKSTEMSFSSELNSSTSANSIKYTSIYKNQDNLSETSMDINVTSPFYPITDTDQKIASPSNSITKLKNDKSPSDQNTLIKEPIGGICKLEDSPRSFKTIDKKIISKKNDDYDSGRSFEAELAATLSAKTERIGDSIGFRDKIKEDVFEKYEKRMINEDFDDRLETDTVSPLPRDKFINLKKIPDEFASIPPTKLFERSISVVDKRFGEMKLSSSSENFVGTQKRSSDILDDLRHMEANSLETSITRDTNMTRKTGYDWEDLKNLEARRQDTFSDSASGFSQARLDVPGITVSNELRKTYVVEPKIQMHDSDSLLRNYTRGKDHGEADDDRESKLGVWTKVKPRKKGENGRRSSSDRALKIIQENSAILHKILTCQAKKRLPDLEEISKEITISPINEEISKIFSPILEKMGLNEHEINEELARINFKDFDHMKVTNGSEFDAKINDELSKLSIIDDNEEISHVDVDEMISGDYLTTREALIDKQINEELSKLLANYDEASPISIDPYEKCSSSQNDVDGLDLTSVSTNVFSYQSSNDSIETKSDLGSIPEPMPEKFHYQDQQNYSSRKYDLEVLSPRSDIDIYRELEKLNKISLVHVLPEPLKTNVISPGAYGTDSPSYDTQLPSLDYMKPEKPFEVNPKSPYDTYTPYNFKTTKISPLTPANSFSRSYDKPHDEGFDIGDNLLGGFPNSGNFDSYEIGKRQLLSKETLEFRVRYDDDNLSSEQIHENLQYRNYHPVPIDLERIDYYSDDVSINRLSKDNDRPLAISSVSTMDYTSESDYSRKYMAKTPDNYYKSDYDRKNYQLTSNEIDSYIGTIHRRDVSPNYHYEDKNFASPYNSTIPNLSIESLEANKKAIGGELQLDDDDDVGCMMKFTSEVPSRESIAYRKASMTLGLNNMNRSGTYDSSISPKSQFNPFPVRNSTRKPKELGLKLGLYSPSSPGSTQSKRS